MAIGLEGLYETIRTWAKGHGINVTDKLLSTNKAGTFDGVSVTMNRSYAVDERSWYLVHALGSIVRWSASYPDIQELFQDLRAAKQDRRILLPNA